MTCSSLEVCAILVFLIHEHLFQVSIHDHLFQVLIHESVLRIHAASIFVIHLFVAVLVEDLVTREDFLVQTSDGFFRRFANTTKYCLHSGKIRDVGVDKIITLS